MKKKYYILIILIMGIFMFFPLSSVKARENDGVFCVYSGKIYGNDTSYVLAYDKVKDEEYVCLYENASDTFDGDALSACSKNENVTYYGPGEDGSEKTEKLFKIEERCPHAAAFMSSGNYWFSTNKVSGSDNKWYFGRDEKTINEDALLYKSMGHFDPNSMNGLNPEEQGDIIFDSLDRKNKVVQALSTAKMDSMDCAILETNIKYPLSLEEKATNVAYNTIIKEYNKFIQETKPIAIEMTQPIADDLFNSYISALVSNDEFFKVCGKDEINSNIINQKSLKEKLYKSFNIQIDEEKNYICGIFGEGSFKILKDLFGIVKMVIPAIIIVLGMIDFLKVVFSGEEKDMKSAGMRLVKRLIIGIIFILLPVLLGFIFDIVGFSENCLGQLI